MTSFVLNGKTYVDTEFLGYGYVTPVTAGTGATLPRWTAALVDAVADCAASAASAAGSLVEARTAGGLSYTYSSTLTESDPGAGFIRFNNATLASATELFISETTGDAQNAAAFINAWDDSTSTVRGTVKVTKLSDLTVFAYFNVTGTITDNGSWASVTVAYVSGNGSLTNADEVSINFIRNGDKGDAGAGVGDGTYGDVTVSASGTTWTIVNNAIVAAKIASNAVTTAKIADGNVTVGKLAGGDLTGKGYSSSSYDAGTFTTGTFTPAASNGNLQRAVNNGAHTLAPPSTDTTIIVQYTNAGSAGTITTSGFTKVDGVFTVTNGDDFLCYITRVNGFTHLNIVAMQ